jgi:hypothetical protein
MAMPPQLQRGLLARRYSHCRDPRPIAEELSQIDVNDLHIPRDQRTYSAPNISLRYPYLSGIRLTCNAVEFTHTGRTQTFALKPIKTGFGYFRFAFICQCQRPVIKLYFRHANLACHACHKAIRASQTLGKRTRPLLKALRLQTFLDLKTSTMRKQTRQRLLKRLGEKSLMPQSNYGTQGTKHWKS